MPTYYDDNFGHWDDMDNPDMVLFYHRVQKESVVKQCVICNRTVRLRPEYDKCNRCVEMLEKGLDPY